MHRDLELSAGLTLMGGPWPNRLFIGGVVLQATCSGAAGGHGRSFSTPAECRRWNRSGLPVTADPRVLRLAGRRAGLAKAVGMGPASAAHHGRRDGPWAPLRSCRHRSHPARRSAPLDADDSLLVGDKDRGILGFSATMARPLSCLDPSLAPASQPSPKSRSRAGAFIGPPVAHKGSRDPLDP